MSIVNLAIPDGEKTFNKSFKIAKKKTKYPLTVQNNKCPFRFQAPGMILQILNLKVSQ